VTVAVARWVIRVLPAAGWTVLVALLPWWTGLPVLLLLVVGAVSFDQHIAHYAELSRRGLRWGLPGWLFAMQRALGSDLLAWGAALLGALVGFSLVVLMESLLDRRVKRAPQAAVSPEWNELALAPMGPPVHIIELSRVVWSEASAEFADPEGDPVRYEAKGYGPGRYVFPEGRVIDEASPRCCFGPGGRWFAASLPGGHGDILWDRRSHHVHRLTGWELSGWNGEQPWVSRGPDGVPASLHEALGQGRQR